MRVIQRRRPMFSLVTILVVTSLVFSLVGCATTSRTKKGAAIGAGTGAALGALIGKQTGNTAVGALIGAAVGGSAGAYIGNYMDNQAAEMDADLEGAKVERVGEGIKVTFDSGILFEVNRSDLQPAAQSNLQELASILSKYSDTEVIIEGHTDATGPEEYNLELSQRRAQSVSNYLSSLGVDPTRFTIMGYGEMQPVASNDSTYGRQQNRRVELAIMANDDLKDAAERASR